MASIIGLSSFKKIIIIITISLIFSSIIGGAHYFLTLNTVMENHKNYMVNMMHSTKKNIDQYFVNIHTDMQQASNSHITAQAIQEFDIAWNQLENPKPYLQEAYITANPHPTGEKDKLNAANDGSLYSDIHRQYHNMFLNQKDAKGYQDILLFNKDGNLVYSVYKKNDYATNMNSTQWQNSALGKIFHKIAQNPLQGLIAYSDLSHYAPSNNVPAGFIASAVYNRENQFVGVIAYQISTSRFNKLLKINDPNYGIYLTGQDGILRSDLHNTVKSDILITKSNIDNIHNMHGRFLTDITGLFFEKALSFIDEVMLYKTSWMAVIEYNQEAFTEKLSEIKIYSILMMILTALITLIFGYIYNQIAGHKNKGN